MKKNVKSRGLLLLPILIMLAVLVLSLSCSQKQDTIVICVNQYVHHPNLKATYDGFQAILTTWSDSSGKEIEFRFQIANGDASVATQIARQQVSSNPDLILALATPSAQASVKATSTIPVIFGAITDPVAAGLIQSLEKPGRNATGSSDLWPYEKQFALIRELLPSAKRIGVLLNPGESNTVASMKLIDVALGKYGFEKIEAPVTTTGEIFNAANSLVGRCDIFYAPADNTVLSGIDAYVKVAQNNKIPLFVGDEGSVLKGGVATYGINYFELGKETGKLAIQVIEGALPAEIPVVVGAGSQLIVNPTAAKKQGIEFPVELLKTAKIVE